MKLYEWVFYDVLPVHADFEEVTKDEFAEIMERSRGERKSRKMPDTPGLARFKSLSAPPPRRATSDGNT